MQNNTSHTLFLPSEFKKNWETIGKNLINDAFDSFLEEPIWLFHLIQDCLDVCYRFCERKIEESIVNATKALKIDNASVHKFLPVFRDTFKEYFDSIFALSTDELLVIKEKLKEKAEEYNDFPIEDLENDMDAQYFNKMLKEIVKSCIFMLIHDPVLTFKVEKYEERKLEYIFMTQKEHLFVGGQFKDGAACLVIFPTPLLKQDFPFNGILPGVYVLPNASPEIINECQSKVRHTYRKSQSVDRKSTPTSIIDNASDISSNSNLVKDFPSKRKHLEGAINKDNLINKLRNLKKPTKEDSGRAAEGLKSYQTSKTINVDKFSDDKSEDILAQKVKNMPMGYTKFKKSGEKVKREVFEDGVLQELSK